MGVSRLYRVASPFTASASLEVDYEQSFDTLYLAHLDYDPLKLTRSDHTSWAFSNIAFGPVLPAPTGLSVVATAANTDAENGGNAYFPQSDKYVVTAVSGSQESRASAADSGVNDLSLKRNKNTLSWSAVAEATHYRIYKSHNGADYGYVGSTEGLTFVDDNILADLTIGPPNGQNPFEEVGDKPSAVTFHEQRLWWGRTRNNPNALYFSRSADFENMDDSTPLRADDAGAIRLVSQGVNEAHQLVSLKTLQVFGSDGIFRVQGSNEEYISATPPPRQSRESGDGSSRVRPIVVDAVALYNTVEGEQVRAAGYSFEIDGTRSDDVTIFSPDFFEGFSIVDWCYAKHPLSVVWAARSDGALLAFTWQREHEVWGWTICPLAGQGKVRRLCAVREGKEDRVYAIIERTIAGQKRYFRERMASAKWSGLKQACHLDCAVTRNFSAPSNVISNLWHLEGETVACFADGMEFEGLVVANGQVNLPEGFTCRIAHVGLPYDVTVETLPLVMQTGAGVSNGKKHQTGIATIKLSRSRPPQVGVREDKVYPIKPPGRYIAQTSGASLLSGDFSITTEKLAGGETTAFIKHRISPLTVSAVFLEADVTG